MSKKRILTDAIFCICLCFRIGEQKFFCFKDLGIVIQYFASKSIIKSVLSRAKVIESPLRTFFQNFRVKLSDVSKLETQSNFSSRKLSDVSLTSTILTKILFRNVRSSSTSYIFSIRQ